MLELEKCNCPAAGVWGATGQMPEQHTWAATPQDGGLAHLNGLTLNELVVLYGIRCVEAAALDPETLEAWGTGVTPAATSIAREIERRYDELVRQSHSMIMVVQDFSAAIRTAQKKIEEVLGRGRS